MTKPKKPTGEVAQLPRHANRDRFWNAEYARLVHHYIASAGTSVEEITRPEFWSSMASLLSPWDRIEAAEESGAWWCELIVLSAGHGDAIVHLLREVPLPGIGAIGRKIASLPGHVVEYAGSHKKWAVRDGERVLRDGFPDQKAAELWLESHSLVVSRTKTPGDAA